MARNQSGSAALTKPRALRATAQEHPPPLEIVSGTREISLPKDHFITRNGRTYAGDHLIIDLWEAEDLDDRDLVEQALIDAVKASGATLLHIHLHKFEDGGGISGVAVLSESHISVHTWPEKGYAAFDAFMCGDAEPRNTIPVLKAAFNAKRVVIGNILRGEKPL